MVPLSVTAGLSASTDGAPPLCRPALAPQVSWTGVPSVHMGLGVATAAIVPSPTAPPTTVGAEAPSVHMGLGVAAVDTVSNPAAPPAMVAFHQAALLGRLLTWHPGHAKRMES